MHDELYRELILDHNRSPRNKGKLSDATAEADGQNPLCGDEIHLYVKVTQGVIESVSFEGHGCAISTASASLMTEALKGKSLDEAERVFQKFREMATGEGEHEPFDDAYEKLEALSGIREFPARVKCATLPWHTLHLALTGGGVATTE